MAAEDATVEARLRQLEATIADMDRRLRAMEGARGAPDERATSSAELLDASGNPAESGVDVASVLSLVGRSFIVFGGAFLLRALTESGRLPANAGVALGLLYAAGWIVAAEFAAVKRRSLSAVLHGSTAVAIGLPLLVEATTRFGLLAPWVSATVLTGFSGLALFVAWRRDLHALAAVTTLATLAATVFLAGKTGAFVPFSAVLIALGVATLWLGYHRDWFWMRWVTALVADVAMVGLTSRAISPQHPEPALPIVAVQLALLGLYLGSFAARTLWKGRAVVPFEVAQTVAGLAVGLGGALTVARASGTGLIGLGTGSLALGAGAYAVAFAFVGRRQGLGANFYFYATLALLLTLTGASVLVGAAPLPFTVALAVLAVASTWMGHRFARNALVFHGAVYCFVAAATSGLLATDVSLLAGRAAALWPVMTVAMWVAFGAAAACTVIAPTSAQHQAVGKAGSALRLAFAVLAVLAGCGVVLLALGPAIAGAPPDAGALATLRTGLLAVLAVALAACTRVERWAEFRWLVYPVLLLAALKLVIEDMRLSQPATLFVALALLGASLVLSPRLVRRAGPAADDARSQPAS